MQVANLDLMLRAIAPIDGISIGNEADKRTWRIDFAPEATDAQKAAAKAFVASFDPSTPSPQEYSAAIQTLIDTTAQSRQYTDGVSLASYKDSTIPVWASEAKIFIAWRDQVWSYANDQMSLVQSKQRATPSVAQLLSELPVIAWPS